jgi:hypothetical protein
MFGPKCANSQKLFIMTMNQADSMKMEQNWKKLQVLFFTDVLSNFYANCITSK